MATKETKQAYSPGLAGVIAGETQICWVDPNAGLMYRGYDIHEMAEKASFEEVAYLLLNGELPDVEELNKFTSRNRDGSHAAEAGAGCAAINAERGASDGHAAHRRVDARGVRSGTERPFARGQHSQIDSINCEGFDLDHRWLSHRARRTPAPGA